jgi:hypothetical protein
MRNGGRPTTLWPSSTGRSFSTSFGSRRLCTMSTARGGTAGARGVGASSQTSGMKLDRRGSSASRSTRRAVRQRRQ